MHRTSRVAVFVVTVAASVAVAADVPVTGSRVVARRHGTREKLFFLSRDGAWIVPPASDGSPGPLQIDVSSPGHPDPRTVHVPPVAGHVGWTPGFGSYGAIRRWKFRNGDAPNGFSSIGTITWSDRAAFKLVVRTSLLDLSAPQGGFRIRVTDGTNQYCARFDASSIVADRPGYFSARGASSAALADCSAASLGEPATSPCGLAPGGASCGGSCLSDEECTYKMSPASCECTGGTGLACGDSAPVCNGYCPSGMHCGGVSLRDIFGRTCGCVPDDTIACGDSEYPTCGGACADPTRVCRPRMDSLSLGPPAIGCTCSPPGACFVGIPGTTSLAACGPGSDCPPGQVCASSFTTFGCYASCMDL
jgi:hypothetical protein